MDKHVKSTLRKRVLLGSEPKSPPPSRFLALPPELRTRIYDFVFSGLDGKRLNISREDAKSDKSSTFLRRFKRRRDCDFALSHTCRQIRSETEHYRYAHRTYGIFLAEDNGCSHDEETLSQRTNAFNAAMAAHATHMRHLELGLWANPYAKHQPSKIQRFKWWLQRSGGFVYEDERDLKERNRRQLVTTLLKLEAPRIKIITINELWLDVEMLNFVIWMKGIFPELEDVRIMCFRDECRVKRLRFEGLKLLWWYTGELILPLKRGKIEVSPFDTAEEVKQKEIMRQMWKQARQAGRLRVMKGEKKRVG